MSTTAARTSDHPHADLIDEAVVRTGLSLIDAYGIPPEVAKRLAEGYIHFELVVKATHLESPIELRFLHAWSAVSVCEADLSMSAQSRPRMEPEDAMWRVDFVIADMATLHDETAPDPPPGVGFVIVECDGHDYHERTKDQAKRDRARDRIAQENGYGLARFTGSELWADPFGCAEQVLRLVKRRRGDNKGQP